MTIKHITLALSLSLSTVSAALAGGNEPITSNLFPEKPNPAEVTGASCIPAKKYVDLTNAGEYGQLGSLFAENAVFMTPTGKTLRGRDEIAAFYVTKVGDELASRIVAISYISDGPSCVMELVATTKLDNYAEWRLGAIDHFKVNEDGLIEHLIVYLRPGNPTTPVDD